MRWSATRVSRLTYVSEGPVPLEAAGHAGFACFREANGLLEHVAIVVGDRGEWPDPVPVRIHSACLTGDLFSSLRCDCGDQLRGSLRAFAARGGGVLLYLDQEGRTIGLGNKLRAYTLQDQGLDTVDADCTLGFGSDERTYEAAVGMLRHLRVARVRLFTNNPDKLQAPAGRRHRGGGPRAALRHAQPTQRRLRAGQGGARRALAQRHAGRRRGPAEVAALRPQQARPPPVTLRPGARAGSGPRRG